MGAADNQRFTTIPTGRAKILVRYPLYRGDGRGKTFSVHLGDNVFQCFDAALDLVHTFNLELVPAGTEKRNG